MTAEQITAKTREILIEQLGVLPEQITPHARFIEDLGCDSLDLFDLVLSFEEEFEIEVQDDEAERITDVTSVEKLLAEKLADQFTP